MHDQQADLRAHDWLDDAPVGFLALDGAGKIQGVNSALEELVGLTSGDLVGHDQETLPSPTHRVLLSSEELIHLNGPGFQERWLRCSRTTDAREPSVTRCFYQDVTREVQLEQENANLRAQIEDLQLVDELTGLPNRKALSQHLELHVSRSRRYANPLSVILVRLAIAPDDTTQSPSLLATARYLRDRLRWVDQIARWDDQSFLVVLPETSEAEAQEVERTLRAHRDTLRLADELGAAPVDFSCATATWRRGDDTRTLLRRANMSLSEVVSVTSTA
jgi:diguanylate cyclase (GGDEF)-like protein/PAS domain S-box-containing protein